MALSRRFNLSGFMSAIGGKADIPRNGSADAHLTRIGANISPLTPEKLAELAIESARKLNNRKDGISYLIAAQDNGIVTALSEAYEEEIIRRLGARDLPDALARVRSRT